MADDTTSSNDPPAGLPAEAAAQARGAGGTLEANGVSKAYETAGPYSSEINTGGGYKQETAPVESTTPTEPADPRPPAEQAGSAGQTLKDQGVTQDSSLTRAESQKALDSEFATADTAPSQTADTTPPQTADTTAPSQTDAAFEQASQSASPTTESPNTPSV